MPAISPTQPRRLDRGPRPHRGLGALVALVAGGALAAPMSATVVTLAATPAGAASLSPTAYVANDALDTLSPIDIATKPRGPRSASTPPHCSRHHPRRQDRLRRQSSDNAVTPIATATNTPGTPIAVGIVPRPSPSPPTARPPTWSNSVSDTVTPIAMATDTPGTAIAVGTIPTAIAITPDGKTAYVANHDGNTVTPINHGHQHCRDADPGRHRSRAPSPSPPTARRPTSPTPAATR